MDVIVRFDRERFEADLTERMLQYGESAEEAVKCLDMDKYIKVGCPVE